MRRKLGKNMVAALSVLAKLDASSLDVDGPALFFFANWPVMRLPSACGEWI